MTEVIATAQHDHDAPADAPVRPFSLEGVPRKAIVGTGILAVFVLLAALAPLIVPYDPNTGDVLNRLASPSAAHWLGTDANGRDELSRLVSAARVDLPLGLLLAIVPMVLGTLLGAFAGYFGRGTDVVVMRSADVVQAFPTYILIIALVAALGPGVGSILIAFFLLAWVIYARVIRAEVLRIRDLDYIAAARAGGLSHRRILFRHVLPNALNQVIVYLPADVLLAIVALAGLSFLGVGVQQPTAEWGAMIAEGQAYVASEWWLVVAPGLVLVILGAGLMLISDGLDDWLRAR